eukprot:CAMPEP_0170527352 /NCGR_PEP_ID=MMETSP0209-20121228/12841_1 /TAXON_ID=665100 ORGANISM="Litonotus pictus, Strain P1" /NCGR_SAMPLE_ID=MMETSP0209 /ASSEMBLY_ACC=CAM_ASM_000301 /LENGTH=298 /DNA_ID=CAMNT_0010817835 /DNA_START=1176 /DNA_END=2072 /DNA_ORIENTATION=+
MKDEQILYHLKLFNFNLLYIFVGIGFVLGYSKANSNSYIFSSKEDPLKEKLSVYSNVVDSFINTPEKIINEKGLSKKNEIIGSMLSSPFSQIAKEVVSYLLLPLLAFKLIFQAEHIIRFMKIHFTRVEGLGDVASLSHVSGENEGVSNLEDIHSNKEARNSFSGLLLENGINDFNFRKQFFSVLLYYKNYSQEFIESNDTTSIKEGNKDKRTTKENKGIMITKTLCYKNKQLYQKIVENLYKSYSRNLSEYDSFYSSSKNSTSISFTSFQEQLFFFLSEISVESIKSTIESTLDEQNN